MQKFASTYRAQRPQREAVSELSLVETNNAALSQRPYGSTSRGAVLCPPRLAEFPFTSRSARYFRGLVQSKKSLSVGTAPPTEKGATWRGKGIVRFVLLLAFAAAVAALASTYGITYDYRYLRAAFLSGVSDGQYHALATRLSERVREANGRLDRRRHRRGLSKT